LLLTAKNLEEIKTSLFLKKLIFIEQSQ